MNRVVVKHRHPGSLPWCLALVIILLMPLAKLGAQPFAVNPNRQDPYQNDRFRVSWDGKIVYGVSRISGLERLTRVVEHRNGQTSGVRYTPGRTLYEPIVLERGRTHADEFEKWADLALPFWGEGGKSSFRKDITIDLLNEFNQVVMRFFVYRCWPSAYVALGPLNASTSSIASESLTLQCEGWRRDPDTKEPLQP